MTDLQKVTHYGPVVFGDLSLEAVVLEDGRRGFVQGQLAKVIGLKEKTPSTRFAKILADLSPNALNIFNKSGYPVLMPHGGKANFISYEIVPELVDSIVDAAIEGRLHPKRSHLVKPCRQIQRALSRIGIVALIDESTGYQYHREPDALQDLFTKLIRQVAADWERRFHPDYYAALCKLFNWPYGQHRALPAIIGQITLRWVYEVVFPNEIIEEIRSRKHGEKLHQWLTVEGGLRLLEKQRDAVEMMARGSVDYKDFEARCSMAFYRPGQQVGMVFPRPH